jgi:hypothetical protein
LKWAVRDARDGMRCKAQSTAMPRGIASICNAAARPYRVDSTDPISVIQWTSHAVWRSRPRVRSSSSASLRVCLCTPRPRDMVLVARDVRGSRPEPRAAIHLIRPDARVWAQPKWICMSCSSSWQGHHPFKVGTWVRAPHAMPEQQALVETLLRERKPAATIGRRRNP